MVVCCKEEEEEEVVGSVLYVLLQSEMSFQVKQRKSLGMEKNA